MVREQKPTYKSWEKVIFFFPVQLLFVHLKKNLILLFFWLLLFAIVTRSISLKYGVPYLFLFPEYLGEVGFLSHAIMGLVTGAFIMAFNISSYVVNGFRFPFLATLNRPFIKYCQNNLIIPVTYSVVYCVSLVVFQIKYEHVSAPDVMVNLVGFLFGNATFIAVTTLYFVSTNKSLLNFLPEQEITADGRFINPVGDLFSNQRKWLRNGINRKEWKVVSYISGRGHIALARDSSHYSREMLERVYSQNRVNATLFQAGVLLAIFLVGWFTHVRWMMIPAAASVLLFFTILVMLASAFYSWFKGWTSLVILGLFVAANFASSKVPALYRNQAYGLDYDTEKVAYNKAAVQHLQANSQNLYLDIENGTKLLENWKRRTGEKSPVAVFVNVPGGGLRSAVWTIRSLTEANTTCNGNLWNNLLLISGSSGGMIGAAYLREYYWRKQNNLTDLTPSDLLADMCSDKLNPVAATAVLNDMFFRFKTFEYDGKTYTCDRALAFETKLDMDTRGWMNRRLGDYAPLEMSAEMPMMILAPTISDDGRKLLISSQPISYLCTVKDSTQLNENIEFTRLFAQQDAQNLNFITALRMSATFPYVFPAASLPSEPAIEILDAGIRDNYGMSNTLKFIYFYKEWLKQNTSGIVIIQVRDQEKILHSAKQKKPSLFESITQPFGTFYNTILDVQDYQMDDQLRMAQDWYKGIDVVEFVLNRSETNPISLSWHLTEQEKERIMAASETVRNQVQYLELRHILGEKSNSSKHSVGH